MYLGVDGGVGAGGAVDGSADHPHQEGALLPLPGPPDRPRQHQRPAGVSLYIFNSALHAETK